jgi:hypothetical protein
MRQANQHQPYWREQETAPDPEEAQFHERHAHLADRVHDFVMQVVILGLIGLVLIQTLNLSGPFRATTNLVEALEGVPWSQVTTWSKSATASRLISVTVMLMNQGRAPGARLLVDNQPLGTFTSDRLTVQVQPGQALTVDGGFTKGPLVFRVVGAAGLASGLLGVEVTTRGNQRPLGVVKRSD